MSRCFVIKYLFCFIFFSNVFSISSVENIYDIKKIVELVDFLATHGSRQMLEKVLIVFEVDDTLIFDEDYFVRFRFEDKLTTLLNQSRASFGVTNSQEFLLSRIIKMAKTELVDTKLIDLLKVIKRDSIKGLAITNSTFKRYGVINNFADFKINQVETKDIDFSIFWYKQKILNEAFDGNEGRPFFKRGFLFRNGVSIEMSLRRFFSVLKWHPELIVFVSNSREDVDSVKNWVERYYRGLNAEFVFFGFTYFADQVQSRVCDMRLISYQVAKFLQTGTWMGESLAKRYMSFTRSCTQALRCIDVTK